MIPYNDRELLARTLTAEAGGEGLLGMLAAGAVINNRVGTGGYGDSLRDVILKPGQFSAWNSLTGYAGGQGGLDMQSIRATEEAYQATDKLLSGDYEDPTGGATHYYNPAVAQPKWGMTAGGDWKPIGNHVFGNADAGRGPTGGGRTMREPTISTQGQAQGQAPRPSAPMGPAPRVPEQERRGLINPDVRDRLVMALEGMTLNPNQALMQAASQGISARREEKASTQAKNRTAEWLMSQGREDLANAVVSGALDGRSAARVLYDDKAAKNDPNVQSSAMLPDMSGTVLTMRDGNIAVKTAGGETLTGQAATDFVRQAQDTYTEQQRSIYRARGEGGYEADIELGGEAERVKTEGGMAPEIARDFMDQAATVRSSLGNMNDAIRAIDEGAQSGVIYNMIPSVTTASASLDNAMQRLGLDVIGSVTFGALSEGEMRLAMDTAVPQNLNPERLREWLVRKREAQSKALEALNQAALWFAGGGTMEGWLERQQSAGGAGGGTPPTTGGDEAQPERLRFNPETGDFE